MGDLKKLIEASDVEIIDDRTCKVRRSFYSRTDAEHNAASAINTAVEKLGWRVILALMDECGEQDEVEAAVADDTSKQIFGHGTQEPKPEKCPTCGSPHPHLHPSVQFEGEVQPCGDPWHGRKKYPELIHIEPNPDLVERIAAKTKEIERNVPEVKGWSEYNDIEPTPDQFSNPAWKDPILSEVAATMNALVIRTCDLRDLYRELNAKLEGK